MYVNYQSAIDAVGCVQSGQRVFVQGSAATPTRLLDALYARRHGLKNVELVSITTMGQSVFSQPDFSQSFFVNSLFVSEDTRRIVNGAGGDYVPVFLSEIHLLFRNGILPLDVALIHVSPPDKHGFCSLGVSVDIARSAVRCAKKVIAQVNPQMPRTHGDGIIHVRDIDALVLCDYPIIEHPCASESNEIHSRIGRFCAELIEDGSTLQTGIGAIPDAILAELTGHKHLGMHTEMFSDGILPLVEKGVITNAFKKKHRGKIVTGFAVGSKKLYDFVDDNPQVIFLEMDYVNDPKIIASNPKVVALNSAIEIDLTGQVCADSIGTYQYSGVGGQVDFMRGAALSEGGKPIIAMNSCTKNGESKIVPFLKQGAGVVTSRAHVHYVVTEYGIASLFGKNLRQRAMALTQIAHPDHRENLEKEIHQRYDE